MDNLLPELNAERAKYGPTMTCDECVALLNAAVWAHGDKAFGLARKDTGNHGTRSDGMPCSVDGIVHSPSNTFIDALVDACGTSKPAWQVGPVGQNPRPFVPAIQPPDSPPPDPPPSTDLTPRVEALEASAKRQSAQLQIFGDQLGVLQSQIMSLIERVAALEANPSCTVQEVQTSRSFGHTHRVKVCLP